MQIFYDTYPEETSLAIALGNFDGVHLGHTRLISELKKTEYKTAVYTFSDHPINVIRGEGRVKTINTSSEKADIIENLGIDLLLFESFEAVRNMTPPEFVDEILIKKLHAKVVFCGFNYRFGKGGEGDADLLRSLLSDRGAELFVIPEVKVNGRTVSSTAIREELLRGNITEANKMLGRHYFVKGTVKHGKALGKTIGFPTVNLDLDEEREIPKYGVYFGQCTLFDKTYPVAASIGVRPTVEKVLLPRLEAHLIGFEGDLYGKEVKIEFIEKIRDEVKFDTVEDLKKQLAIDVELCRKRFSER